MSIFTGLLDRRSYFDQPKWTPMSGIGGHYYTEAGIEMTEGKALGLNSVWACQTFIAYTLGSNDVLTQRERANGTTEDAKNHPYFNLLKCPPSPEMTAFGYYSTTIGHILGWGNGFSVIEKRGGEASAFHLRTPERMHPMRNRSSSRLFYRYYEEHGGFTDFPEDEVLHFRGFSYDGILGYSPIRMQARLMGLAWDNESSGASFFRNRARPSLVVRIKKALSETARTRLEKQLNQDYGGHERAHRVMAVEEDAEVQPFTIPPEEAQFIQSRGFNAQETANIYHCPYRESPAFQIWAFTLIVPCQPRIPGF